MRKIVCIAVPFIVSDYHLASIQRTMDSLRRALLGDHIHTIAVANILRYDKNDFSALKTIFNEVINNDKNILARAWNIGIARARELNATHILIHNLDLTFHSASIQNLCDAVDSHPEFLLYSPRLWHTEKTLELARLNPGVSTGGHMCCYMIRPNFTEIMGEFDELFAPAYQEDADMFRRMRLRNQEGVYVNNAFVFHTEGGTLRGCLTMEKTSSNDKISLAHAILSRVKDNDIRYLRKWGGTLGQETFLTPYNSGVSINTTKQDDPNNV